MRIHAQGLRKAYRGRDVVCGVNVEVAQGEVVGLLGPNGAGKTTTFYMIVGAVRPNEGRVFIDGQDVTRWPMYRRARHGMGYLPQEASVFRKLSVLENLLLVLEMRPMSHRERLRKAEELLEKLHITQLRKHLGLKLSGGERRRVEIARALACEPKFILLDEPFTGIDPKTIEELQEIIGRLREDGIGVLITDHNVSATFRITDRLYILVDGHIIFHGTPDEAVENEMVRKHYLGGSMD
ncbi:MAG: LPS export ABC transporter ATP-binding protein [Fimbriimonadia bacterium]|jgi:lipopolysaccharide export system ATP-binding protein